MEISNTDLNVGWGAYSEPCDSDYGSGTWFWFVANTKFPHGNGYMNFFVTEIKGRLLVGTSVRGLQ